MSKTTFLTRVVIENYKSIAYCDVPLGPLRYLVGPNGAGKSNFLDALRFLSHALTVSLSYALQERVNAGHLLHRSLARRADYFGIRLEFNLPTGSTGYNLFQVGLN